MIGRHVRFGSFSTLVLQGFEINVLLGSYQPTQTLGEQEISEHR